jgi:PTH1 family peptidyl-tRNA hydrolase
MKLIFGLGNPGKKYQDTRHNIGAKAIERLVALNLNQVVLAGPTTFMNESGLNAKSLIKRHYLKTSDLIVIHDDLDLPLGQIKIVKDRGSAGHKGVSSIIKELGSKNFVRFRVGICPKTGKPNQVEKFVLQKFNPEEKKIIEQSLDKTIKAIEFLLENNLEKTMAKHNA